MQVPITKEFNVLTRLIENYPEIETIAKLLSVSKDVKKLVLSTSYLIVPSHSQEGKRCVLKPGFLRKFPNLKSVHSLEVGGDEIVPHHIQTIGCHVVSDDVLPEILPKIKGISNIHVKIDGFIWYTPDDALIKMNKESIPILETFREWEKEERHLRTISILEIFVNLCQSKPEGVKCVTVNKEGIFCSRNPYTGKEYGSHMMSYSIPDGTFYAGNFAIYNIEEEIMCLYCDGDEKEDDDEDEEDNWDNDVDDEEYPIVKAQVFERYKAYLQILSEIDIRNINDRCSRFIFDIIEDSSMLKLFNNLEGVVFVDYSGDENACVIDDLISIFRPSDIDITQVFSKAIKHYYLLSDSGNFVSYINDNTVIQCRTLSDQISNLNGGNPLSHVLTFPDIDQEDSKHVRKIFPNANIGER